MKTEHAPQQQQQNVEQDALFPTLSNGEAPVVEPLETDQIIIPGYNKFEDLSYEERLEAHTASYEHAFEDALSLTLKNAVIVQYFTQEGEKKPFEDFEINITDVATLLKKKLENDRKLITTRSTDVSDVELPKAERKLEESTPKMKAFWKKEIDRLAIRDEAYHSVLNRIDAILPEDEETATDNAYELSDAYIIAHRGIIQSNILSIVEQQKAAKDKEADELADKLREASKKIVDLNTEHLDRDMDEHMRDVNQATDEAKKLAS